MTLSTGQTRSIVAYVVWAYGLTWLVMLPWVLSQRGLIALSLPTHWEVSGAFGPALAALLVTWRAEGASGLRTLFAGLARWRVKWAWLAFVLLSPLAVLGLAVASATLTSDPPALGRLPLWTAAGLFDLVVVGAILQSLGEEPGWRGFMLQRLRMGFGPLAATAVLAPVWIVWHLPAFLARPEFGVAQLLGLSLGLAAAAVWLTLIYDATRSLLMAVLWHALINIARGVALSISTSVFTSFSALVLLGAAAILGYWTFAVSKTGERAP